MMKTHKNYTIMALGLILLLASLQSNAIKSNELNHVEGGETIDQLIFQEFNATYSYLNFGTYLGGNDTDEGYDIATDSNDNIYVTGYTYSADFPVLNGNQDLNGSQDVFITSFNPDGTLRWSTCFGGNGEDESYAIAVDSDDNIYVAGLTQSPNFPTLNAFNDTFGGIRDGFLSSFTSEGILRWSTYLGGSDYDTVNDIAIDSEDNVIVAGDTSSSDFPTIYAYQSKLFGSFSDAFISSFDQNGQMRWSTYLGGSGSDEVMGVACDYNSNVYVLGTTGSTDFPVLYAFQSDNAGKWDGFVSSFSTLGHLRWSSYLGGSDEEYDNYGIAVDSGNNVYVVGGTYSTDFPMYNAFNDTYAQVAVSAFITGFTSEGRMHWSTFLGGSIAELITGIAIDHMDNIFVTGLTMSPDMHTRNGYHTTITEEVETFLTSFSGNGTLRWGTYLGACPTDRGYSIDVDGNGTILLAGYTDSETFPVYDAFQENLAGYEDAFAYSLLDPLLDFDEDGLSNLQEYKLATNPKSGDTDGDGMPDNWEVDNDLDPLSNDASLDPDTDGLTNIQEFQEGTNPQVSDNPYVTITESNTTSTDTTNTTDTESNTTSPGTELTAQYILPMFSVFTIYIMVRRRKRR